MSIIEEINSAILMLKRLCDAHENCTRFNVISHTNEKCPLSSKCGCMLEDYPQFWETIKSEDLIRRQDVLDLLAKQPWPTGTLRDQVNAIEAVKKETDDADKPVPD